MQNISASKIVKIVKLLQNEINNVNSNFIEIDINENQLYSNILDLILKAYIIKNDIKEIDILDINLDFIITSESEIDILLSDKNYDFYENFIKELEIFFKLYNNWLLEKSKLMIK
jgi:hypothetical protein